MKKSRLAIASFVLSLIPIISFMLPILLTRIITTNNTQLSKIIDFTFYIILDFISLTFLFLIASIILGIVALIKIKRNKLKGRGFAIAGIIISVISAMMYIATFIYTFSYLFD